MRNTPEEIINNSVNHNENFELVYLRWRYLVKSPNPDPKRMEMFDREVRTMGLRMYRKFLNPFSIAGFEKNDILSISQVYLVSYLGLFSLVDHPDRLATYKESFLRNNHRLPTDEEIITKDRSNFLSFLAQRLSECANICSQKNKNIVGSNSFTGYYMTDQDLECNVPDYKVKENESAQGYKKITKNLFMRAAKSIGKTKSNTFIINDRLFRRIYVGPKRLNEFDFDQNNIDNRGSEYNSNPEDILLNRKDTDITEELIAISEDLGWSRKRLLKKLKHVVKYKKTDANRGERELAAEIWLKLK